MSEPVQTALPSRITYLWCIRSGTPATARAGTPSFATSSGRALGRRRHGDRAGMIDVEDDAYRDAAGGGGVQRADDDLLRVAVEPKVVEGHVERGRRGGEERRHLVRDLDGGLAAVGERADLEHPMRLRGARGAQLRLARPLLRLVLGQGCGRVDVPERRVRGTSSRAAAMPKRLARTEPSPVIFMGPNPGSAPMRLRSSAPSFAPVQTRAASPSYSLRDLGAQLLDAARHRPREAVDRGALAKHLLQPVRIGRGDDARRRASRAAASASVGPRNAVGTVTCWSSAKPISSASGSSASSASASSSPVK